MQFFAEWGLPLSSTQVGPAHGKVTAFFNGRIYNGDPADLPLGYHYQIQLDVGTPVVAPVQSHELGRSLNDARLTGWTATSLSSGSAREARR